MRPAERTCPAVASSPVADYVRNTAGLGFNVAKGSAADNRAIPTECTPVDQDRGEAEQPNLVTNEINARDAEEPANTATM